MINYNIDFCNDSEQIIHLWHSVFKDGRDDILFFLDNCKNKKCLGAFVNGELVSMLFLVDCRYGELNGRYVYAVSTLEKYRGFGVAGSIIKNAKKYMKDFLWLIPAEESLIDYYKRFGFEIKLYSGYEYTNKITFDESTDIIEYLYEGCELKYPVGMVFTNADFKAGNIKEIR